MPLPDFSGDGKLVSVGNMELVDNVDVTGSHFSATTTSK